MSSALRRFGILECIACGGPHEFVTYDPHVKHISDAFCAECGFTYGRKDEVEFTPPPITGDRAGLPMTRRERKGVYVIGDAEAAAALVRLQARHPGAADANAAGALRARAASPADAVAATSPASANSLRSPAPAHGPDAASLRSSPSGPAPAGDSLRSPPAGAAAVRVPDFVGPRPAGPHSEDADAELPDLFDVEDDGSRRAAFLRSLGEQWQSPKSP